MDGRNLFLCCKQYYCLLGVDINRYLYVYDQSINVHLIQLGKKPPKMTLVDLPGYGHAVADSIQMKQWKIMSKSYLSGRSVLSMYVSCHVFSVFVI